MSAQYGKEIQSFHKLWQWIKNQLIQDVPEDTAFCEFDCRNKECLSGKCRYTKNASLKQMNSDPLERQLAQTIHRTP